MSKYKKTIGRFGEDLAKNFLIRRGYKIVASNFKIGRAEFDIVALHADETVFIEVKTIASKFMGPADEALKHRQIRTLMRAMIIYCRKNRIKQEKMRLDFISVDIDRYSHMAKLKHYKKII
jgi:putative endonuclease